MKLVMVEKCGKETVTLENGTEVTGSLWRRVDGTGQLMDFFDLPVGACYYHEDGIPVVKIWYDAKKTEGFLFHCHGWEVTGTLPNITCSPSILVTPSQPGQGWHGFIRNGELVDA